MSYIILHHCRNERYDVSIHATNEKIPKYVVNNFLFIRQLD